MKPTILVDFDNTIANSAETIIRFYNAAHGSLTKFDSSILEWDFAPYIPTEDVESYLAIFTHPDFFRLLRPLKNCAQVLKGLSEDYEIVICTKKDPQAVMFNDDWLKEWLPFINKVFYMRGNFDKSLLKADWRIDDRPDCLNGEGKKILFGDYAYQKTFKCNDEYIKAANWLEVRDIVNYPLSKGSGLLLNGSPDLV